MKPSDWESGRRSAWLTILADAVKNLGGYTDLDAGRAAWIIERERAVAALRSVCAKHGDNDWTDDLDLSDVIEKHLERYLD